MNSSVKDRLSTMINSFSASSENAIFVNGRFNTSSSYFWEKSPKTTRTPDKNGADDRQRFETYQDAFYTTRNKEKRKELFDSVNYDIKNKFNKHFSPSTRIKRKIELLTEDCKTGNMPSLAISRRSIDFDIWNKKPEAKNAYSYNRKQDQNQRAPGKLTRKKDDKPYTLMFKKKEAPVYLKTISIFNDIKPAKRFYISNLDTLEGCFLNKNISLSSTLRKDLLSNKTLEQKMKEKEVDDVDQYGNFSLEEKRKKEKKSKRNIIKNF